MTSMPLVFEHFTFPPFPSFLVHGLSMYVSSSRLFRLTTLYSLMLFMLIFDNSHFAMTTILNLIEI